MSPAVLAQADATAQPLTPLWVIGGYLALLVMLGLASVRFFRGTSKDFFVASRSIGPFLLLMSVFGTTMTGFALVGSSGKTFNLGIGVYGLMASYSGLIHSAVFFLVGIRLWAVGKRYGYVTQVQYFRDRFESPALGRLLFPILVLLVVPYLLVGVISACKTVQPVTAGMFPETFPIARPDGTPSPLSGGVPPWLTGLVVCAVVLFYVFLGGVRSAAWANTFQTLVFMVLGVTAFSLISQELGGLREAAALVREHSPEHLARDRIPTTQFFTYFVIPLSVGMFPHLFQHWLTAKSAKTFRLTVVAHPVFIGIVWVPCVLIGMWAAGLHAAGELRLPQTAAGGPNANAALGSMVDQLIDSPVLAGLLTAGILAAIMSSLDSQFVCLGTMFTNDVVVRAFGEDRFTDRQLLWLARGFIVAIVTFSYGLSMFLLDTSVFDLGVWCFTGFGALFPLVLAAVYWKRATKAGAIACVSSTAVVWSLFFMDDVVSPGVFGIGELHGGEYLVAGMMPAVFIFAASVGSLVVVSLLTPPPSPRTIDKFMIGPPKAAPPEKA